MLNQKELVNRLYKKLNNKYKPVDIDKISRELFTVILDAVKNGEDVSIPSFGKFFPRFVKGKKISKTGIKWLQGKIFEIPDRFRLGFKGAEPANRALSDLVTKLNVIELDKRTPE